MTLGRAEDPRTASGARPLAGDGADWQLETTTEDLRSHVDPWTTLCSRMGGAPTPASADERIFCTEY